MTAYVCTARVYHGDTRLTATGTGPTRVEAFVDAVANVDIGYRPSEHNTAGGIAALTDFAAGRIARTPEHRYAYLEPDIMGGEPTIQIGWCDFLFAKREVKLWAITAQVEVHRPAEGYPNGWTSSRQVPTFYLDPLVQGILTEAGAVKIAEDILSTAGAVDGESVTLHVTATPIY